MPTRWLPLGAVAFDRVQELIVQRFTNPAWSLQKRLVLGCERLGFGLSNALSCALARDELAIANAQRMVRDFTLGVILTRK